MYLLKTSFHRYFSGIVALITLASTYLFQEFDYSSLVGQLEGFSKFIFNKSIRFIINDVACLLLIAAIFRKSSYLRLSALVFILELVVLLPLYFVMKLSIEGDSEISSPLLSQLHRMIINPLLMIVLILGFIYQDYYWKKPDL